jgi:hypothetical protein
MGQAGSLKGKEKTGFEGNLLQRRKTCRRGLEKIRKRGKTELDFRKT